MKIAIIGTGYVGLVTGICFAETGLDVWCVDIQEEKVNNLKAGKIPIYEPNLETLLHRNQKENRIQFTTDLNLAVQESEVIFLALPTPDGGDGAADLSFIRNMAHELAQIIKSYKVVVNKSTVPVGTADEVREIFLSHENHFVDVVSNPEFLREGYAVEDFLKPDRIVIGSSSARATEIMTKLYKPFVRQGNPIYIMDERSSEMTKYAANSFLALKISFMNEVANLCEKVGANVDFVRKGIGADSRIGNRFLFPGIGYGGSCFPKDVKALHNTAKSSDYQFKILESVIEVNDLQRQRFIQKVFEHLPIDQNTKIAIWGLAFKPNTDDIREAPALNVIESLLSKTKHISVFDPEAMNHVKKKFPEVHYGDNLYEILDGASALLILTEWQNFRTPNFKLIKEKMKQPLIFDGRNVFELEDMEKEGFQYFSIGRKAINKS